MEEVRNKEKIEDVHKTKIMINDITVVWIGDLRRPEDVAKKPGTTSYLVKREKRTIRRNRLHLIPYSWEEEADDCSEEVEVNDDIQAITSLWKLMMLSKARKKKEC